MTTVDKVPPASDNEKPKKIPAISDVPSDIEEKENAVPDDALLVNLRDVMNEG
ncbi:hypothetical protein [Azospirillum sp. B506]|uniref:hypothetical protein n=1 Tax=Azospirillum sp. B506 TaxID=137721 RepID=UPI001B3C0488|nr:hypothetical protein [Azospirillum sp. B506]